MSLFGLLLFLVSISSVIVGLACLDKSSQCSISPGVSCMLFLVGVVGYCVISDRYHLRNTE